jgi:hypothetical protein
MEHRFVAEGCVIYSLAAAAGLAAIADDLRNTGFLGANSGKLDELVDAFGIFSKTMVFWKRSDIPSSPFFRTNYAQLCTETGEQVGIMQSWPLNCCT